MSTRPQRGVSTRAHARGARRRQGGSMKARIAGVSTSLPAVHGDWPERTLTSAEVEAQVGPFRPSPTIVRRMTGIESRHVMRDDQQASDLAAEAAAKLLADHGTVPDLLIFASASQDLVEPATAHIVAAKLGLTC